MPFRTYLEVVLLKIMFELKTTFNVTKSKLTSLTKMLEFHKYDYITSFINGFDQVWYNFIPFSWL